MEDPLAGPGVGFDAGRVEDFVGEVAAEEAPRGAVEGGADVVLVAADDFVGGQGGRAVGEDGAVLDEGLVGSTGPGLKPTKHMLWAPNFRGPQFFLKKTCIHI